MARKMGAKKNQAETTPTIYPVILAVPPEARDLTPRQRVRFLSRHAREALRLTPGRART